MEEILIPYQEYYIQADLYGNSTESNTNTLIMAHGLGGEKACQLDLFAEFYQTLGFNVCLFDHRGFGKSTGPVKNLVDKSSQLKDWKTVIEYLEVNFNLTSERMILWGYSFSGGHVLTLAAQKKFKAVISNFPHVDGLASLTLYPKKYLLAASFRAIQDLSLANFGKIQTMPVVSKNRFAILAGPDCYEGFHSIIPEHIKWDNAVPARIVATIGLYRPTRIAHLIESPTLVIGATLDSLIPITATRKMAKKIKHGQYLEEDCGHFDLFHSLFKDRILKAHQAFLNSL